MSVGRMPRTFAQTADLSGCALRKATICSGSQLPCRRVPPNRPGVPPENVPPLPGGGLSPGWSVPTGGMNGLAPGVETGSRATAVGADVPVRVSTATVPDRINTAAARTAVMAMRESRRSPARPGYPAGIRRADRPVLASTGSCSALAGPASSPGGGGASPGASSGDSAVSALAAGVRFLLVSQLLLRLRPRPDPIRRRPAHGRSRYKTVRLASLMCRTLCRTCPSACSPELLPDGGSRHVVAPPHICRLSPRLGNEASITRARERPVHTSSPPPLATLSTSAARAQRPGGQRPIVPPASPPPAWPRAFFAAGRAGHRWRASTRLARNWPRRLWLLLTYCGAIVKTCGSACHATC